MTHDDLRTQGQSNVLQQKGAALGGLGSMSSHGICAACLGLGTSLNTKPGSAGNCDVASCIKSRALGRRTAPDPMHQFEAKPRDGREGTDIKQSTAKKDTSI